MGIEEARENVGGTTAWMQVLANNLYAQDDGERAGKHRYNLVTTLALLS